MAQAPPHCGMGAAGQGVDEKGGGQTETSWTQLPMMHRTLGLGCGCAVGGGVWQSSRVVAFVCIAFNDLDTAALGLWRPMATHPNTRGYCSALCCAQKHFLQNEREAVQSPPSDLQYTFLPLSRPAQGPVLLQPLYPFTQRYHCPLNAPGEGRGRAGRSGGQRNIPWGRTHVLRVWAGAEGWVGLGAAAPSGGRGSRSQYPSPLHTTGPD